jgi:hypothetical protein
MLTATLLTAVAVGVAGPIAFVGVLAAALARASPPRGHAAQLAVAIPWGAAIVVGGRRRPPAVRPRRRDTRGRDVRAWSPAATTAACCRSR